MFRGIRMRVILQEMIKMSVLDMSLKISNIEWLPHLPGANESSTEFIDWSVTHMRAYTRVYSQPGITQIQFRNGLGWLVIEVKPLFNNNYHIKMAVPARAVTIHTAYMTSKYGSCLFSPRLNTTQGKNPDENMNDIQNSDTTST